jgi:hypothetical protein
MIVNVDTSNEINSGQDPRPDFGKWSTHPDSTRQVDEDKVMA